MKNILLYSVRLTIILTIATLFSGCYMFRKKNRCGDCPKWKIEAIHDFFTGL